MAPTILDLLDVQQRDDFDGSIIEYTEDAINSSRRREALNVTFWDPDVAHEDIEWKKQTAAGVYKNVWTSVRLQTAYGVFYYSIWCDGSKEFYEMDVSSIKSHTCSNDTDRDPHQDDFAQMHNPLRSPSATAALTKKYFGRPFSQLIHRLDTLLLITKTCKGDSCRQPWHVAFPDGKVNYLYDAMNPKYDEFFANQPKVDFECVPGDIRERSGPLELNVYVERWGRRCRMVDWRHWCRVFGGCEPVCRWFF